MKTHIRKITYLMLSLSITCSMLFSACSDNDNNPANPDPDPAPDPTPEIKYAPSAKGITDMALIYCVDQSRPEWNAENLAPYVYRTNGDKIEWLFDGFLFLEIYASANGVDYDYAIASIDDVTHRRITDKYMWDYLSTKIFEDGKGPNGLEKVLDDMYKEGHVPPSKRQVMIGIPNPAWGDQSWGELDGVRLGFWDNDHRFAAVKWYMDKIEEAWKSKNYKHIELAGFYWTNESLIVGYADDVIVKKVQAEVTARGYEFSWIPYNGAGGVSEWQNYGFTTAYQQPNYFFDDIANPEKIERAIATAQQYNMAMEMEFDDRILTSDEYRNRFHTYVEEFKKAGVFDERKLAYYQGTKAILEASRSNDTEVQKIYKTLGDILVKRAGKFTEIEEE